MSQPLIEAGGRDARLGGSGPSGVFRRRVGPDEREEGLTDGGARSMPMGDQVEIPGQFQARDMDDGQFAALDVTLDGQLGDDGHTSPSLDGLADRFVVAHLCDDPERAHW